MTSKLSRRLSANDAAFLYFERQNAPLHIGSLGVYEGRIPFDRFAAQIDSRMPLIPRYRQRVAFVPVNLALPTWEDDPEYRILNHVRHVSLPPPGSDAQLFELTAELVARPLDRTKPLWEMTVIDGLDGDRTGIVSKVHHCMVDGVSGIGLLLATLDLTPEPAPPPDAQPWRPAPLPDPGARVAEAFWDQLDRQRQLLQGLQEGMLDPGLRLRQSQEVARAIRLASPDLTRSGASSPFTTKLSSTRRVAFSEMSFVEIREIRSALGGTVNDVVLAILAGALRSYLGERNATREPRVAIPVNVRLEDEAETMGNRISFMVAALPIGEADAATRLRIIRERLDTLKRENQAGAFELLARFASLTPPPLQALVAGAATGDGFIDLICTNVPGPMIPLYSVGHLMLQHYPLVPLSFDMGLGMGVTSYNQRLYVGLMADPSAVPDVERLRQCLDESFLELRSAAGVDVSDLPVMGSEWNRNGAAELAPAAGARTEV